MGEFLDTGSGDDIFGDLLQKKAKDTLRIGFLNVRGFTLKKHKYKDTMLRQGISSFQFDVFGMAETNTDWRLMKEEDRLYMRTKAWWEALHLSYSNNCSTPPVSQHQWGGTALFSINKAAHRVLSKGKDSSNMGRWCWTHFQGKSGFALKVFACYCPNFPTGPLSAYSQQRFSLLQRQDSRCPRAAFLQDICQEIQTSLGTGNRVMVLLDGNMDMRNSDLSRAFQALGLQEAILGRHGHDCPSTYRRNTSKIPIDGIWLSPDLSISGGGYLDFDSVIPGADHRCLWIDVPFRMAFGHSMPGLAKPKARRLHCRDPRVVANYVRTYEKLAISHDLPRKVAKLSNAAKYPLPASLQREYEALDLLRCTISCYAEKRCRKLRKGQVAFSPALQHADRTIKAYTMLKKRSTNQHFSSRHLARTLKKAGIHRAAYSLTPAQVEDALKLAYQAYFKVKKDHIKLRETYLDELAESLASSNNSNKLRMLQQLRERESQRSIARKIKYLRGKAVRGGTSMVTIETEDGKTVDLTERADIEKAIMDANRTKFVQSHHRPFYQPPLSSDFGYKATTPAAAAALAGVYDSNHPLPPNELELLHALQTPNSISASQPHDFSLSVAEYRQFWRTARENTSCYPDALSFSTMKAGASSTLITEIDCGLVGIPVRSGFVPSRWKKCLDVMILKKSGITTIGNLRTIVLFPVDCNFAFKHIGRQMMRVAEHAGALAPEQYGSRKRHRATDLALNKVLTFDTIRQLKRAGAFCSNDAKSCYDLIGHAQASLAMQRLGVPKSAVDCLFSTLQQAEHQVRTSFGDSMGSYGGALIKIPMHGIGQGNGAGPAIWAVVSTPLLDILRKNGFGFTFVMPLSGELIRFAGFAFVDDTDLLQILSHNSTANDVRAGLQSALSKWEGCLSATSGAIVPEKTFWYLIDFAWSQGHWRYKTISECPGDLSIPDIHGTQRTLLRVEVTEAKETLGIFIAPSGNLQGQIHKMTLAAKSWVEQMRAGHLSRTEMWTALNSTIWRTLSYPLPATNLTHHQWESIMSIVLQFSLPAMGICRNFPRTVVFAPKKFFGLGIKHLYTTQEILRLKDMILHTATSSISGQLYRASLELLYIELGMVKPLHELPYRDLSYLVTDSLVKSSWEFLDKNGFVLETDIAFTLARQGDCYIMDMIDRELYPFEVVLAINQCRLYLRAMYLSDLVDGSGRQLLEEAWNGRQMNQYRCSSWPNQCRPPEAAWGHWKKFLSSTILGRGRRLKVPLGAWLREEKEWPWYFCSQDGHLYRDNGTCWECFPLVHDRPLAPVFCCVGTPSLPPTQPNRATVYYKGNKIFCTGYGPISPPISRPKSSLCDILLDQGPGGAWCWQFLDTARDYQEISLALRQGQAVAVSDGSFATAHATAALFIEDPSSGRQMSCAMIVPGGSVDMSAYRAELAGIYATLFVVQALCTLHGVEGGCITFACDGKSALNMAFASDLPKSVDVPSFDLLVGIYRLRQRSRILWKYQHVASHQDDHKPLGELDAWERLNVAADLAAKNMLQKATESPRHYWVAGEPWSLWYKQAKLSRIGHSLYDIVHSEEAYHFWIGKDKTVPQAVDYTDWEAIGSAMQQATRSKQTFISKQTVGMCGVGKWMRRWKQWETDECPRCSTPEDAQHVLFCKGKNACDVWKTALTSLGRWMESTGTDPELSQAILEGLRGWRYPDEPVLPVQSTYRHAMDQQSDIGWNLLLEGWLAIEWASAQQQYYERMKSRRSGRRWVAALVRKLWMIAWDLWEHRNGILHESNSEAKQAEAQAVDRCMKRLYAKAQQYLESDEDRYLTSLPLRQLLKHSIHYKKEWNKQALEAIAARKRQKGQSTRALWQMRNSMRQWLDSSQRGSL